MLQTTEPVQIMPMNDARPVVPPASERRELMTLEAAAAHCTVSYETFRRWVSKGVIRHVVIGPHNLKRVYRRDVEALIRDAKRTS